MNKPIMFSLLALSVLIPMSTAFADDQVISIKSLFGTPLQVHVGDNIIIKNDDTVPHNIIGKVSNGDSMNTGTIPAGGSTGFGFAFPGNFTFYESSNPQKRGTMLIYDPDTPFPALPAQVQPITSNKTVTVNQTVQAPQVADNATHQSLPAQISAPELSPIPNVSVNDTETLVNELQAQNTALTNQLNADTQEITDLQNQIQGQKDSTDYKALYLQWKNIAMSEFKILSVYLNP